MKEISKNLLIQAIKIRIESGDGTADQIINTYKKFSDEEKEEILSGINEKIV